MTNQSASILAQRKSVLKTFFQDWFWDLFISRNSVEASSAEDVLNSVTLTLEIRRLCIIGSYLNIYLLS